LLPRSGGLTFDRQAKKPLGSGFFLSFFCFFFGDARSLRLFPINFFKLAFACRGLIFLESNKPMLPYYVFLKDKSSSFYLNSEA